MQDKTTTSKITLARAKINTAVKTKNSKKVKITLKKIKKANKYEIVISQKKNCKKVLVKKTVKKVKVSITSKKLKGRKKLYVRVRAVRTVSNKKYTGKWSPAKKVTIKK